MAAPRRGGAHDGDGGGAAGRSSGSGPGRGWSFERKLDGYRCLAWVDGPSGGDGVALRSRTGQSYDAALVELRASLRDQVLGRAILDGELVAYEGDRTSFQRLQRRIGVRPSPGAELVEVRFAAFDLLWFDEHDLRPSTSRHAPRPSGRWCGPGARRGRPALHGDPAALLARACAAGWEGLMAKRLASTYQPRRSRDWRKLKCTASQEVVVGGWTEPSGSRTGLGALLVGVHDETGLRYAGRWAPGSTPTTCARSRGRSRPSSGRARRSSTR
ncbi:MAG: hypothetical protein R2702_16000 [Acidimicrobiales bacterium]